MTSTVPLGTSMPASVTWSHWESSTGSSCSSTSTVTFTLPNEPVWTTNVLSPTDSRSAVVCSSKVISSGGSQARLSCTYSEWWEAYIISLSLLDMNAPDSIPEPGLLQ